MMKKAIALLAALMMVAVSAAALGEDDLLSKIRERGTVVIGTEGNWSPWTYHDENDTLTGFDIEVGKLIADYIGVTPDYREAPWGSLLTGVETGVFDLICNGVGYTLPRAESVAFSTPYFYEEAALVVRADIDDIHTVADLAGRITTNSPGSTYADMAIEAGGTVEYVDTLGETMAMLEQGRAEATINALSSVEDYLQEHPDAKIKIVQKMPGAPICIPMEKGERSETLLAAVNEALEKARQDGTLSELSMKYFGKDQTKAE